MGYRLFLSSARRRRAARGARLSAAWLLRRQVRLPTRPAIPSSRLSGEWKGGGTVTPAKGDPMKVACKATY